MRHDSPRNRIARAVVESLEQRRLLALAAPATYAVGDNPQAVATADLNGAGRSAVVTADANANTVSILLANANGTLAPAQHFPSGPGGIGTRRSVAIGDLNGDGKRDLVTASGGAASILMGNGNGAFAAP